MKISKPIQIMLWLNIFSLNLILRYPATPHEIGWDSFAIHSLANSISIFGDAKWWIHPLSIIGLYPYSYASAVPFMLSGISQLTSMNMEWTVWFFSSVFLGLLSIFTAYLIAGEILDNDIFKYLVAFGYSTSQGILYFTTWTVSTRGAFIVLLPLFIYLLLKSRTSKLKYGILSFILFLILLTTHRLIFFTVPIFIAYLVTITTQNYFHKIQKKLVSVALIISFVTIFILSTKIQIMPSSIKGSGFDLLPELIITYARYIGVLGVFGMLGLIFLLSDSKKSFEEWFLTLVLLGVIFLLGMKTYMAYFILPFAFLLAGIGIIRSINILNKKRKAVFSIIILSLLLSVGFSGFYQFWHTNIKGRAYYNEVYMEEATYTASLWIKDNLKNRAIISNDDTVANRILSISEVPTLTGLGANDISYGFVNKEELKFEMRPLASVLDWKGELYTPIEKSDTSWYRYNLMTVEFSSKLGQQILEEYNLTYEVDNKYILSRWGGRYSKFPKSVHEKKDNIYDNGKITIWSLKEVLYENSYIHN